jgi:hypothetical protein
MLWENYTCYGNVDNINPPEGSGCSATYKINSTTPTGFTGQVDIKNTGSIVLTSWLATWNWSGNEHLRWIGGAGTGKNDTTVEATSLPYTSLQPGQGTTFTFEATSSGGTPVMYSPTCYANGNSPEPFPTPIPTPTPVVTPEPTPEVTPEPTPVVTPEPTPSPIITPAPTPVPTPTPVVATCSATISRQGWDNGFVGTVTVNNTGTVATNTWKVTWTWGGNQRITNSWNAIITSSGRSVTAASIAGQNEIIPVGGNTQFGFQASFSGSNAAPVLTCSAT